MSENPEQFRRYKLARHLDMRLRKTVPLLRLDPRFQPFGNLC